MASEEEVKLSEGNAAATHAVAPGSPSAGHEPGPDEDYPDASGGDGGGGLGSASCKNKLKWLIKPAALIAFCLLQAVWSVYWLSELTDNKDDCLDAGGEKDACNDLYDDNLAAFALSLLGYLVITGGCIAAIVVNMLNCNDCCGKLGTRNILLTSDYTQNRTLVQTIA